MPVLHLTRCAAGVPTTTLVPRARAPYVAGAVVQQLQAWLAALGHPVGHNGHYGPVTQAAVRTIQRQYAGTLTPHGVIVANGIVGPATWCLLGTLVAQRTAVAPLRITTPALPAGTAGAAYQATLAATGGTAPYTWQIVAGVLPAGISLLPTGTLTGTAQAATTAGLVVQVRDAQGRTATRSLTLTIQPATAGLSHTLLQEAEGVADRIAQRLHTTPQVVELGAAGVAAATLWALTSTGGGAGRSGGRR